jgi:PAS domain S-box-containing protein
MLGYTSAQELLEVVTNIGEQVFVESQHWFAMKSMLQVIREVVKIESRCRCKDGREIIVNLSVWPVLDDREEVRYFEGLVEDITERKRAEAALSKRETYLATLVEVQRQLLAFEGDDLPYDAILRLLGTVSHTSRAYIFRNHRDAQGHLLTSHLAEWCAEGISPEITNPDLQNIRYDASIPRWAEVLARGEVISGIVANFPEQEWRFLAPLGIRSILVLPLTVNGEFFGFIGFDDCREARIWSPSEVSLLQAAAAAISLAKEQQLSEQQVQQQASALQKANQELAITLENLKTTQQELIHSEKMAALGQLVAGVAHEINSPLAAIRSSLENISQFLTQTLRQFPEFFRILPENQVENFSALLAQSLKKDTTITAKEQREFRRKLVEFLKEQHIQQIRKTADMLADMGIYDNIEPFLPLLQVSNHLHLLTMIYEISGLQESVQIMTTATERASKVVFALKTYTHHDKSHAMVQADIIEGIETVLTLYHNQLKQGVEVLRRYEALQPIFCYPDELNQVWTNLIHNAIHAMKGVGILEIAVSQQKNEVIVRMTDSGCGIPEDIKAQIFEPFFTTKSAGEGSGLGLDIVKKIIDKHQGDITVESQPGRTTFTVVLPVVTDSMDQRTSKIS